jgi:hypothetical protein
LLRRREWVFLAQFPVRVTTHSLRPRAWVAQAKVVRLVPAVRVVRVVQVVRLVRADQVDQVVAQAAQAVQQVPASGVLVPVSVAAQALLPAQVSVAQAVPVVQVAVQVLVAVAVSVVEPPVPLVRAALAVRPRRESQSAPSARNTNKELHRA